MNNAITSGFIIETYSHNLYLLNNHIQIQNKQVWHLIYQNIAY